MKKLVVSAIFVGSNLAASLIIVMLLVRFAGTEERAAFFLFQTVFFPMTALLSQTKILQVFRGAQANTNERLLDLGAFMVAAILLWIIGGDRFTYLQIALFALSIPLTYRTASGFAAVQRHSTVGTAWIWPLGSAVVRVLCAALLLGQSESLVFCLAAFAGFAVSLIAQRRINIPVAEAVAAGATCREQAFLATLFFFAVTSFAFQWDRIILGQLALDEMLIISGVCLVWVLSPVSAIFATIYRARALEVFSDTPRDEKERVFKRYAGQFAGLSILYGAILVILWGPLNALAFPFLDASALLPLILILAVMCDRIGNLRTFGFALTGAHYLKVGLVKLVALGVGVLSVLFFQGSLTLVEIYAIYLAQSLVYCVAVWRFL